MYNEIITADCDTLFSQAPATVGAYFTEANRILKNSGLNYTVRDCIELSKIMAADFNTSIKAKLYEADTQARHTEMREACEILGQIADILEGR